MKPISIAEVKLQTRPEDLSKHAEAVSRFRLEHPYHPGSYLKHLISLLLMHCAANFSGPEKKRIAAASHEEIVIEVEFRRSNDKCKSKYKCSSELKI